MKLKMSYLRNEILIILLLLNNYECTP